jgi:hypothetical protein
MSDVLRSIQRHGFSRFSCRMRKVASIYLLFTSWEHRKHTQRSRQFSSLDELESLNCCQQLSLFPCLSFSLIYSFLITRLPAFNVFLNADFCISLLNCFFGTFSPYITYSVYVLYSSVRWSSLFVSLNIFAVSSVVLFPLPSSTFWMD